MAVSTRLIVIAIALTLALEPVGAYWASRGTLEPDTQEDMTGTFMTLHSPTNVGENVVYLSAFKITTTGTLPNPNLALLSAQFPGTATAFDAMLGVWRDCNHDGYIGDLGLAEFEYRSELLSTQDLGLCPVKSIPSPIPRGWMPVHNDGVWVREFIPIGPSCNLQQQRDGVNPLDCDTNPWTIHDEGAKVWGDNGRPGESKQLKCPIVYLPAGTLNSTGGLVKYGECQLSRWVPLQPIIGSPSSCVLLQGLQVCDQPNPYGNPADQPAFYYQCGKLIDVTNPVTGQTVTTLYGPDMGSLVIPPLDAGGSLSGGVTRSFGSCTGAPPQNYDIYRTLQGNSAVENAKRTSSDWDFIFYEGYPSDPQRDPGSIVANVTRTMLGTINASAGALYTLTELDHEPMWVGTRTDTLFTNPYFNPEGFQVPPAQYFSFYAFVSAAAVTAYGLTLPSTTTGAYGAEWCGTSTSELHSPTVNCDPSKWYPVGKEPNQVVPGYLYELRDVDCYDTTLWSIGPNVGLNDIFVTGSCPRPDPSLLPRIEGVDVHPEDCVSDGWQERYGPAGGILNAIDDSDRDGATNLEEFRWQTIPVGGGAIGLTDLPEQTLLGIIPSAEDYDHDGWSDGAEIHYWDVNKTVDATSCDTTGAGTATIALLDEDSLIDLDQDGLGAQHDPDADGDGLGDGYEIFHGSYPELQDSDCPDPSAVAANSSLAGIPVPPCITSGASKFEPNRLRMRTYYGDNMSDSDELAHWASTASDTVWGENGWKQDLDGDGIASNLLDRDSDGDGLLDGDEAHHEDDVIAGNDLTDENPDETITKFWSFDTDEDGLLDGSTLSIGPEDSRFSIFEAAGICERTASDGLHEFVGEKETGTPPNAWNDNGTCASAGGAASAAFDFWDTYRYERNVDTETEDMPPALRQYVLDNSIHDVQESPAEVGEVAGTAAETISNVTQELLRVPDPSITQPVTDETAVLSDAALHALDGIMSCSGITVPSTLNPKENLGNLQNDISCAQESVDAESSWLLERGVDSVVGLADQTISETSIPSLINATTSRTLSKVRETLSNQSIKTFVDEIGTQPLNLGALSGSSLTNVTAQNYTQASVTLGSSQRKSAMPTFLYDHVSLLGLGFAWPQVRAANEAASGTGLGDPIGAIDSISFSAYAISQGAAAIGTSDPTSPTSPNTVRLDIDSDSTADLEITLTPNTEVVQAPTTTGTGIRVSPSVLVKKLNYSKVFNATVMVYMQVPNTNYIVGLGYTSLNSTDAPDQWQANLQAFDAFETTDRTFSYTTSAQDNRATIPLHVNVGAFQVDNGDQHKAVIQGRETISELEATTNWTQTITAATAREHNGPSNTPDLKATLTHPYAGTYTYRLKDNSTNIQHNMSMTASVLGGQSEFLAMGSQDQLAWHWTSPGRTPFVVLNYTANVGTGLRRGFDLDANDLGPAPSAADGLPYQVQFAAVHAGTLYNFTSTGNVTFHQYESTNTCAEPTQARSLGIVQTTGTYCAGGRLKDVSYFDLQPASAALTNLKLGSRSGIGSMGVYINDTHETTLNLTTQGTLASFAHRPYSNATRQTTWNSNGVVDSLDVVLRLKGTPIENLDVHATSPPATFASWIDPEARSINIRGPTAALKGTMNLTLGQNNIKLVDPAAKALLLRKTSADTQASIDFGGINDLRAFVDTDGSVKLDGSFAATTTIGGWIENTNSGSVQTKGFVGLSAPAGPVSVSIAPRSNSDGITIQATSPNGISSFTYKGQTTSMNLDTNVVGIGSSWMFVGSPAGKSATVTSGDGTVSSLVRVSFLTPSAGSSNLPRLPAGVDGVNLQQGNPNGGNVLLHNVASATFTASATAMGLASSPASSEAMMLAYSDSSIKRRINVTSRPETVQSTLSANSFEWSTSQTASGVYDDYAGTTWTRVTPVTSSGTIDYAWTDAADFSQSLTLSQGASSASFSFEKHLGDSNPQKTRAWRTVLGSPARTSTLAVNRSTAEISIRGLDAANAEAILGETTFQEVMNSNNFLKPTTWTGDAVILTTTSTDTPSSPRYVTLHDLAAADIRPRSDLSLPEILLRGTGNRDLYVELHDSTSHELAIRANALPGAATMFANLSAATGAFSFDVSASASITAISMDIAEPNKLFVANTIAGNPLPATLHVSWIPDGAFGLLAGSTTSLEIAFTVADQAGSYIVPWPTSGHDTLVLDSNNNRMFGSLRGIDDLSVTQTGAHWNITGTRGTDLGVLVAGQTTRSSFAISPIPSSGALEWNAANKHFHATTSTLLTTLAVSATDATANMTLVASGVPVGTTDINEAQDGQLIATVSTGAISRLEYSWAPTQTAPKRLSQDGVEIDLTTSRKTRLDLADFQGLTANAGSNGGGASVQITRSSGATPEPAVLRMLQSQASFTASGTFAAGASAMSWVSLAAGATTHAVSFAGAVATTKTTISSKFAGQLFDLQVNQSPSSATFSTDGSSTLAWVPASGSTTDLWVNWKMGSSAAKISATSLAGELNAATNASALSGFASTTGSAANIFVGWSPAGATIPTVGGTVEAFSLQAGASSSYLLRASAFQGVSWTVHDTAADVQAEAVNVTLSRTSTSVGSGLIHVIHDAHKTRVELKQIPSTFTVGIKASDDGANLFISSAPSSVTIAHTTSTSRTLNTTIKSATGPLVEHVDIVGGATPVGQLTVDGGAGYVGLNTTLNGMMLKLNATALPNHIEFRPTSPTLMGGSFTTSGTGSIQRATLTYSPRSSANVASAKSGTESFFVDTLDTPYVAFKLYDTRSVTWNTTAGRPLSQLSRNGTGSTRTIIGGLNYPAASLSLRLSSAPPSWTVSGAPSVNGDAAQPHSVSYSADGTTGQVTLKEYEPPTNQAAWVNATGVAGSLSTVTSSAAGGLFDVTLLGAQKLSIGADDGSTRLEMALNSASTIRIEANRAACLAGSTLPLFEVDHAQSDTLGAILLKVADAHTAPNVAGSHVAARCDPDGIHVSIDQKAIPNLHIGGDGCSGPLVRNILVPATGTKFGISVPTWDANLTWNIKPKNSQVGIFDLTIDCREEAPYMQYHLNGATPIAPVVIAPGVQLSGLYIVGAPLDIQSLLVDYDHDRSKPGCGQMQMGSTCIQHIETFGLSLPATADILFRGPESKKGVTLTALPGSVLRVEIETGKPGAAAGGPVGGGDPIGGPPGETQPADPLEFLQVKNNMDLGELIVNWTNTPNGRTKGDYELGSNIVMLETSNESSAFHMDLRGIKSDSLLGLKTRSDVTWMDIHGDLKANTTRRVDVSIVNESSVHLHADLSKLPALTLVDLHIETADAQCRIDSAGPAGTACEHQPNFTTFSGTVRLSDPIATLKIAYDKKTDDNVLWGNLTALPAGDYSIYGQLGHAGILYLDGPDSSVIGSIAFDMRSKKPDGLVTLIRAYNFPLWLNAAWDIDGRQDWDDMPNYVYCDTQNVAVPRLDMQFTGEGTGWYIDTPTSTTLACNQFGFRWGTQQTAVESCGIIADFPCPQGTFRSEIIGGTLCGSSADMNSGFVASVNNLIKNLALSLTC